MHKQTDHMYRNLHLNEIWRYGRCMIINEICWLYIELVATSPMLKGGIIDEIDQGDLD